MIAKRGYKVRVLVQPVPTTTTPTNSVKSAAPTPTETTISTQISVTRFTAKSILVTVYKLATGQFAKVPCLTTRLQNKGYNPPPLEDIHSAPIRQSTPWPNAESASENLFETRKDWPIPPALVPAPAPLSKQKNYPKLQQSPMPW